MTRFRELAPSNLSLALHVSRASIMRARLMLTPIASIAFQLLSLNRASMPGITMMADIGSFADLRMAAQLHSGPHWSTPGEEGGCHLSD
jgi:hypothetical protein